MRWFAALLTQPRRFFMVFVAGELLLAMAIPFMVIQGYHTLLDSRAGKFVEEPTRFDPGWRALVDPTQVVGVAEVDDGTVTGVTLLIHQAEVRSAGAAILVPGSLQVDGVRLSDRSPADAVDAVGRAVHLGISRTEVMDTAGWAEVLGDVSYVVDAPDPVFEPSGEPLFSVGPVTVNAQNAAAFVGRPTPGAAAASVQPRRLIFWNAVIGSPPVGTSPLAEDLQAIDSTSSVVIELPTTSLLEPVVLLDAPAAETKIREVVAYPAGAELGDRLQVRILDRTGSADLEEIAAAVAAEGIEVLEIGNASIFDDGETQIIGPPALVVEDGGWDPEVQDLTRWLTRSPVPIPVIVDTEATDFVVTVVIGRDFDLANLY